MLNFSKIKITLILAFCALAIYFALPSFLLSDQNLGQEIQENQDNEEWDEGINQIQADQPSLPQQPPSEQQISPPPPPAS